jgi:hypothetical protein
MLYIFKLSPVKGCRELLLVSGSTPQIFLVTPFSRVEYVRLLVDHNNKFFIYRSKNVICAVRYTIYVQVPPS